MREKPFPVGTIVVAHGLSNNKFNGKKGKVKKHLKDRIVVTFPPPDNDCALKIENIKVADGQKASRSSSQSTNGEPDEVVRDRRDSPERTRKRGRRESRRDDDKDRRTRRRRGRDTRDSRSRRGRDRERDRRTRRRRRDTSSSWDSEDESDASSYSSRSRSSMSEAPVSASAYSDEPEKQDPHADDASSESTEEYEEDRWIRVPVAGCYPSMDEIFWCFTQFGQVTHVLEDTRQKRQEEPRTFYVAMRTRFYDAMTYMKGKEVSFASGTGTLQCAACASPKYGSARNYVAVNDALHELLVNVGSDDAADGLEVFFKANQWVPKDFIWGRWVAGQGWLEPRQSEDLFRKMPPKLKIDERYVHIGSLWEGATVDAVYNVAAMYSSIEFVSPLKKSPNSSYAIVLCKDKTGAQSLMKHLNGVQVADKRLRVDQFTGDPEKLKSAKTHPQNPLPPCPTAPTKTLLLLGLSSSLKKQFANVLKNSGTVVQQSDGLLTFPTPGSALVFLSQHNGRNFFDARIEMQFVPDVEDAGAEGTRHEPQQKRHRPSGGRQ